MRRPAVARALRAALLGVAVLAGGAEVARAQTGSFFDEFGASARSTAMGQAFVAVADEGSAAYYNPAGLAFASPETTLGWRYVKPRTEVDFADPEEEDIFFDTPSTRGLAVNVISALDHPGINERFPWVEPLSLGTSLFLSLREITSFRTFKDQGQPYFFRYDTRPGALSLNISLAYRITDWLSIGGGIMPYINSFQDNNAQVRLFAGEEDPTGGTDLEIFQEASFEMAPVGGVMLRLPVWGRPDGLRFGFSYRGRIKTVFGTGAATQALGFALENGSFVELAFIPGEIVNLNAFVPQQWTLGFAIHPSDRWIVGFDATLKEWSDFRIWLDTPPTPRFEDTVTYRVGVEHRVPLGQSLGAIVDVQRIDVRAGYAFEPTANPSLDGPFNLLDSDEHVVSGGLGFQTRFFDKWGMRLDVTFQAQLLEDRSTDNQDDPLYGPLEARGNVYQWSGDLSFAF